MKTLDVIAGVLVVIGAINWGIVGATGSDLVGALLGPLSPASRAVYLVVGLAGLYQALQWKAIQHRWMLAHS